jgi:hypothetical protein
VSTNPEVVVRLIGGLGNQLFQIQRGLNFVRDHGGRLVMDDSFLATSRKSHEVIALPELIAAYPLIRLGWADLKLRRRLERLFFKLGKPVPAVLQPMFFFEADNAPVPHCGRCVIDGFWQDKKYLNDGFLLQVRQLLYPRQQAPASEPADNLVCVHVRRGDYLTNRHFFRKQQIVLAQNYYQEAIAWHRDADPARRFHLYTDDEDWAQAHFAGMPEVTVVKSAHFKSKDLLAAMAAYRHFILANSSLSWWAAVLCRQSDSTAVAPKMWGKNKPADPYLMPGWHAI